MYASRATADGEIAKVYLLKLNTTYTLLRAKHTHTRTRYHICVGAYHNVLITYTKKIKCPYVDIPNLLIGS